MIINYSDEIENNAHNIELDFLIDVDMEKIKINLSSEHEDYKWVKKDSEYFDDFILSKLKHI